MLKELIGFVDKYNKNPPAILKDYTGKKFIIIKTKEKEDSLEYDGIEILDDDSKIATWLDKNKHYDKVIKNFDYQVLPDIPNKALGSKRGLLTYSFFAFKLSEKNLSNFVGKVSNTKFPKDIHKELIDNIHKILKSASPNLTEKHDDIFTYLNYCILIYAGKKRFDEWYEISSNFIVKRTSYGKADHIIDGECFVCNKNTEVSTPGFLTNYDAKKIFLRHITRHSKDGKGIPLRACSGCVQKLNQFEKILKDHNIKIFPLFITPDELDEEIKLLGPSLDKDENKFNFIFEQLKSNKMMFDFYLVVKIQKDYFFFDYIAGYKWEIGKFTDFFDGKRPTYPVTRNIIESRLAKILTDKSWIQYFGEIKGGSDNQQITLTYSLRQKMFDFVYRNQNTITAKDLQRIILFRVEKCIKNNTVLRYRETFNLFFNRHLLLQNEDKTSCILDYVIDAKENIMTNKIENFEITSHEAWAYFAGQIAYYLVSLSKSKDKTYGLLEPFTNKSTVHLVKKTIEHLLEQYRHEISLNNKRFKKIASSVLSYEPDSSFIELKIPFYVGAFDENIIYFKKKDDDGK